MNIKKNLITGALIATSFFTVAPNVLAEEPQVTSSITFPDVPNNHWAKDDIYSLVDLGYVSGYTNGTYGLNDNVTRGQAASILSRWLKDTGKLVETNVENPFTDVSSDYWAKDDILQVVNAGYMVGKGNGKFEPNATVTRAEMATILTNVLGTEKKAVAPFDDIANHWGKEYIDNAYSNELVLGMGDNKYVPNGNVTRAQFATFIMNGVDWKADVEEQTDVEEKYYGDVFFKDLVENDKYNVIADDVLLPKTQEQYEFVFKNEKNLKLLSDEALQIIKTTNDIYNTNYQLTDLSYGVVISDKDTVVDGIGSIPKSYTEYNPLTFFFNYNEPASKYMAQKFLDILAPNLYYQIEDEILEVNNIYFTSNMIREDVLSKENGSLTGYSSVSILPLYQPTSDYLATFVTLTY